MGFHATSNGPQPFCPIKHVSLGTNPDWNISSDGTGSSGNLEAILLKEKQQRASRRPERKTKQFISQSAWSLAFSLSSGDPRVPLSMTSVELVRLVITSYFYRLGGGAQQSQGSLPSVRWIRTYCWRFQLIPPKSIIDHLSSQYKQNLDTGHWQKPAAPWTTDTRLSIAPGVRGHLTSLNKPVVAHNRLYMACVAGSSG